MGWNGVIHTCTLEDREQDVKRAAPSLSMGTQGTAVGHTLSGSYTWVIQQALQHSGRRSVSTQQRGCQKNPWAPLYMVAAQAGAMQ